MAAGEGQQPGRSGPENRLPVSLSSDPNGWECSEFRDECTQSLKLPRPQRGAERVAGELGCGGPGTVPRAWPQPRGQQTELNKPEQTETSTVATCLVLPARMV